MEGWRLWMLYVCRIPSVDGSLVRDRLWPEPTDRFIIWCDYDGQPNDRIRTKWLRNQLFYDVTWCDVTSTVRMRGVEKCLVLHAVTSQSIIAVVVSYEWCCLITFRPVWMTARCGQLPYWTRWPLLAQQEHYACWQWKAYLNTACFRRARMKQSFSTDCLIYFLI